MLADSHCHLDLIDLKPFNGRLDAVVEAARSEGVEYLLSVSVGLAKWDRLQAIGAQYPNVWISAGLHPNVRSEPEPDISDLVARAGGEAHVVAIGETGLDYYRSDGDLEWQRERFRTHVRAAREVGLPLIIHSRDAEADTIRILWEEGAADVGGVMHCFTGTRRMAEDALELGFYISFSGIVTFKNAEALRETARTVPLERLMVETDSPYLAPVPFRGKPNQPGYVRYVAECLAGLHGLPAERLATVTTDNFFRLFKSARPA